MEDNLRCKYELQHVECGKIRGKLRGNLKCGSAQPGLYYVLFPTAANSEVQSEFFKTSPTGEVFY